MTDWNIFYSSLAQSTAAFVGLLGAFIITKIISNEQQYNENLVKIEDYLVTSRNLRLRLKDRYFSWYNKRNRENALDKIATESYKDNSIIHESAEKLYEGYNFSEFDNKDDVIQEILNLQEKLRTGEYENE